MSVYEAPNIMICRPMKMVCFRPNDGFDTVAHGILVLELIELKVFEFEPFLLRSNELSEPALSIRLRSISFAHRRIYPKRGKTTADNSNATRRLHGSKPI
eukprot:scaffold10312_cov67-Cylindrotheca_fusiformis.AAC.1